MTAQFIFDREQERAALAARFAKRRPLLVHGPAGVGKTLLITAVVHDLPDFLYCGDSATINAVYKCLAAELWHRRAPRVVAAFGKRGGIDAIKTMSALNLKGVTVEALRQGNYCLVLDHIRRPPHAFAAAVRELMRWADTPVVTISRSAHMEDAGFLQPIYSDRGDRFELKNFEDDVANHFAHELVERFGLLAENMSDFLARVLEFSGGNPGAIVAMIKMAKDPKYRSEDRIKVTPLYIDFRLQSNAVGTH
jgi:hypothetical protein